MWAGCWGDDRDDGAMCLSSPEASPGFFKCVAVTGFQKQQEKASPTVRVFFSLCQSKSGDRAQSPSGRRVRVRSAREYKPKEGDKLVAIFAVYLKG